MAEATSTTGHLSIGEVLALLLEEFPDVTISKIRFLESQGLIDPERTASGYRKFYDHDVELLRCILREQRENYLPLKVIKDRIDSGEIDPTNETPRPKGIRNVDSGNGVVTADPSHHPSAGRPPTTTRTSATTGAAALFERTTDPTGDVPAADAPRPTEQPDQQQLQLPATETEPPAETRTPVDTQAAGRTSAATAPAASAATPEPTPPADTIAAPVAETGAVLPGVLLSADELCAMSGLDRAQLADLQSYGVVATSRDDGPFDDDDVEIATVCKRLLEAGLEARHLRGWRVAADREVGLLEQLIQPLLRQRNPQARAEAVGTLAELEAVGGRLRAAMVRASLRQH